MYDNRYKPIEGKPHLVKDLETNALINTDEDAYNEYIETYRKAYNEKQKLNKIESEVESIKNDLNEIKQLLISINQK